MAKSWITSSLVISSSIGRFTGRCSALISAWPPACSAFHIHCLPVTEILSVPAGGWNSRTYRLAPQMNRPKKASRVAVVQVISNPKVRSEMPARLTPLFWR